MVNLAKVQAILLAAGRGSRLTQLIGTSVPKCLLPVCGNPLIYYPLRSLKNGGFLGRDILVIIQDREDVRNTLAAVTEQLGIPGVEVLTVPEDSEDFGTAESLRIALTAKKIKKDVLLMSCDTITDLPLQELSDFHEIKDADLSALFLSPLKAPEDVKLPGPKTKVKNERDIVGLKPYTDNMIYLTSEADCEEEVKVPVSTLKHCPYTKLITGYVDAHIYLISLSVLKKLLEISNERHFINLKGEFFPYLIQNQFNPQFIDHALKFYACVQPSFQCVRVNSLPNFALANKSGDWIKKEFLDGVITKSKSKIGKGCKLWGTTLGEHCEVEDKSKVTNVIALNGVTVRTGATVEGSILSCGVVVGANAVIQNCLVGPQYEIPADSRFLNEQLIVIEEAYFGE